MALKPVLAKNLIDKALRNKNLRIKLVWYCKGSVGEESTISMGYEGASQIQRPSNI